MTRLELDQLPDPDAEQAIYAQMRAYDESERMSYAQIGLMALAVERRSLWKFRQDPEDGLPCRSFARWVRVCAPYAYSTVYAALRDVAELQDVPADELAQVPQSNFRTLKQLSSAVRRDPKILQAAKTERNADFVAGIKANFPTQHILADTMFRCPMNEEQLEDVEKAIQKSMLRRGCASKTEVLWLWALDELSTDDSPLESEPDAKWGHA